MASHIFHCHLYHTHIWHKMIGRTQISVGLKFFIPSSSISEDLVRHGLRRSFDLKIRIEPPSVTGSAMTRCENDARLVAKITVRLHAFEFLETMNNAQGSE